MLIVGTVIGAGFCSGREIVSFFGSGISVFVAPICGLFLFSACVLFLSVGSRVRERSFDKVNEAVLGKFHLVADLFLLLNNLIVLSAMIAGINSLCRPITSIPVFGILLSVVCAVISSRGAKGLLDANFLVVPVIIISLVSVCVVGIESDMISASLGVFRLRNIPMAAVYISMNMILASTVLTTTVPLGKKEILWGSGIAAACITVLLFLLITALNCTGSYSAEMPILEISATVGRWLYLLLCGVIGISIFTTMLTAVGGLCSYLDSKTKSKKFNAAAVVLAGGSLSFFGFTRVVDLFYPLVGLFGIFYIVVCAVFMLKKRTLTRHKPSKESRMKTSRRRKIFTKIS